MADVDVQFPPPSYSTLFFPFLLKAAGDKTLGLGELLKSKKSLLGGGNSLSATDKPKKLTKRWRSTAKHVLQGDWRKKDAGTSTSSTTAPPPSSSTTTTTTTTTSENVDSAAPSRLLVPPPPHHQHPNVTTASSAAIDDLDPNDMTLLQLLALNALDLTVPASDILLKNRKNSWVQLSGHEGAFAPAGPGTIWKKRTSNGDTEVKAYEKLMEEEACDLIPCFYKEVEWNGDYYIEMEDLLYRFKDPSVMDIKMGLRTFAESEVTNAKAREDLYQKMVKLDPNAPTEEEHSAGAVTKLRYMSFREQMSSSSSLGFRIEALKLEGSAPVKDLKLVRTWDEVVCTMGLFLSGRDDCRIKLNQRLRDMRDKIERSPFFRRHEIVGSSILIVMDQTRVGAWMIDFVKATPVHNGLTLTHRAPWVNGNQEDGYLLGLDNLIRVLDHVNVRPSAGAAKSSFKPREFVTNHLSTRTTERTTNCSLLSYTPANFETSSS